MSLRKPVNATRMRSSGRRAKLGQNFLRDTSAARRIVEALGDLREATVLEIGPGRGALTALLAERAQKLIAVEIDEALARNLQLEFAGRENVEIRRANILHLSLAQLADSSAGRLKVVGNIPYYITSDILLHLFAQRQHIDLIVIMVQKEVADRLTAQPGTREYGLLTVTAHLFSDVEHLFTLPPEAFSPPPQVDSSLLRLHIAPKSGELNIDADQFLAFCRLAFAHKRKTLFNNLRREYRPEEIKKVLAAHQVREDVRAEALSIEQLALISNGLGFPITKENTE
jgi:16S rRNA (adenine1518-N6/adenine1519-N6)-dimethyltransferase